MTVTAAEPGDESCNQNAVLRASEAESHVRRQNWNQPGGKMEAGRAGRKPFQKRIGEAAGVFRLILSVVLAA
ncbi:hypothetical protein AOR01nite_22660 [Acetobacter orleanensis]|uniref:Uncharacterized protein n=1 Tax=Acetobacter orleanensis TaxID=104099 RepID=A0A4Y3TQR3_9PROT|nr:hypothetical protein Abol_013_025 [Acetobacter orleanensis JCM 7639]GEB83789.1 hypothetical protein AOR01nite_22660 [Acetobacter orleanensis]